MWEGGGWPPDDHWHLLWAEDAGHHGPGLLLCDAWCSDHSGKKKMGSEPSLFKEDFIMSSFQMCSMEEAAGKKGTSNKHPAPLCSSSQSSLSYSAFFLNFLLLFCFSSLIFLLMLFPMLFSPSLFFPKPFIFFQILLLRVLQNNILILIVICFCPQVFVLLCHDLRFYSFLLITGSK